jgi:hypothetical protein
MTCVTFSHLLCCLLVHYVTKYQGECLGSFLYASSLTDAAQKCQRSLRDKKALFMNSSNRAFPGDEPEQFRFLRAARLANVKGSVGLISAKASAMSVTIPIDLSTRPFIPLPRFFNSRRVPPLLNQSPVLFLQQSACHLGPAHDHGSLHVESFIGLLCIIVLA